jgi:hypothetical protein
MRNKIKIVRLTVLVDSRDVRNVKYLAVDRGVSASEIVRTAVKQFLIGHQESAPSQEPASAAR